MSVKKMFCRHAWREVGWSSTFSGRAKKLFECKKCGKQKEVPYSPGRKHVNVETVGRRVMVSVTNDSDENKQ